MNPVVASPNPATANSIARPAFCKGGRCARETAISSAPIDGAARMIPKPSGPTFKISVAYTGSSVTAPPSSTANISSVIAASSSFALRKKRIPSASESSVAALWASASGRPLIRRTIHKKVRLAAASNA